MWIPLDCRAVSGAGKKILDVSCEWAAHFTKQKREWKVFYRLLDRKTMDNGDNVYCFLSSTKQGEEGKRNNFRKFFGRLLNVHELNWKIQFKRLPWETAIEEQCEKLTPNIDSRQIFEFNHERKSSSIFFLVLVWLRVSICWRKLPPPTTCLQSICNVCFCVEENRKEV